MRIKVSDLRRVIKSIHNEEVSFSRGVEMLNEIAMNYKDVREQTNLSIQEFHMLAKASQSFDDFMIQVANFQNKQK